MFACAKSSLGSTSKLGTNNLEKILPSGSETMTWLTYTKYNIVNRMLVNPTCSCKLIWELNRLDKPQFDCISCFADGWQSTTESVTSKKMTKHLTWSKFVKLCFPMYCQFYLDNWQKHHLLWHMKSKWRVFHINLVELYILAILPSFKVLEENLKYLNLILSCSKERKNRVNKRKAAGLLIQC